MSFLFCIGNAEDWRKDGSTHISIAFPTDPTSLDPIFSTDLTTEKLVRLLYSPLFRIDERGRPAAHLVSSFMFSKDKSSLTLHLKSNVNSKQVIDSITRLVETPGPRKEPYQFISSIHLGTAPSEITIRLSEDGKKLPEETILLRLSLPASSIQGDTGPYELIQWKKGNSLVLKKRSSNKEHLPKYIHIRIIPQSTSGLFLFSKNQLDTMKLSDFLLTHPITQKNSIIQKKGRSVQYVAINNTNPCYDQNFREAVNLAIDRKAIIQKILDSQAELTIASIPISRLGAEVRKDLLPIYNLRLAKSYLSKSKCFPEIQEKLLEFRMRGDDENQSKGRAVAENLRQLGLSIKIKGMEKAPLYRENGEKKGDLTFLTWYADYESPLAFIDPVFHSEKMGNGGNRSFYSNPAIDKAIQENSIEDAIQILIQDKPWIFLWSIQENYLISDEIKNYPSILEYL